MLTHLTVSDDVERSRRFYTDVLGGETVFHGARLRAVQAQLEAEDTARLLLCGNLASDGDAVIKLAGVEGAAWEEGQFVGRATLESTYL